MSSHEGSSFIEDAQKWKCEYRSIMLELAETIQNIHTCFNKEEQEGKQDSRGFLMGYN